jgi:hypothetical protein
MPRQLIYTSVPRGLAPGQSGYCTVARSRDLREALIPRLEKLSYYTPEPNYNPIICAHRVIDLRGAKFHVLSRISDAGLDFTKRRSFLAHHLIFEPLELTGAAPPAEIFLRWKGWLQNWHGDPQWLEDNRPLPAPARCDFTLAKSDVWVTGNDADRKNFLHVLGDRGAAWDVTFTNDFQPSDNLTDFDIKAAWPSTPGCEAARRLGAAFISLDQLPTVSRQSKIQEPESAKPAQPLDPATSTAPQPPKKFTRVLPLAAVALTLLTFIATVYLRNRTSEAVPDTPPTIASTSAPSGERPSIASELNFLLPLRPTWLALADHPTLLPPIDELMRELRANEVFTKDLTSTLQTNLQSAALPAVLLAQPDQNLLRFTANNHPPVEILVSAGATFKTGIRDSFAVEIPGRFRILAIKSPVELSRRFLLINTNILLQPDFEERIHRIELPPGAQLALRPLVLSKGAWIDPLAPAAHDFAIIPSTVLDLLAVESHARQVISDRESKLRAYENEQTTISNELKKLLTDAQTPEQLKARDRLNALQLAIPKAQQDLESLRAKAAAIPSDPAQIDRFALFLCLSNVNTEVFRFTDKP